MSHQRRASIPGPSAITFQGGINHPDLWLWDSWITHEASQLHLYCLALARVDDDGTTIAPHERNQFAFHIRRFRSENNARTWSDCGCVMGPGQAADGSDARNIWSGSVAVLPDGRTLFSYTGIRETTPERNFLQTICLATGPAPDRIADYFRVALSDPHRDYDLITARGYYLGARDQLGDNHGEEGGPILAWRDPFILVDTDQIVHLFWSAKTGPKTPAVAHAILKPDGEQFTIDQILPPIELPDSHNLTQAEVPKIYHDDRRGLYYLLISACNRLYEGQPDEEVTKEHRLYKSTALAGPWQPYRSGDSLIPGLSGLFGASLIDTDFETGNCRLLAPYTEMVEPARQLTFPSPQTVNIYHDTKTGAELTA